MIIVANVIHSLAIAFSTVAAAIGVARGQGITAKAAFTAIDRQPATQPEIFRATVLALALIETAAILGLLISFFLFFSAPPTLAGALGEIGIALAIGIPGLFIGWLTAGPTTESISAIARQPFLARRLTNFMLLVLSILETPLIFGFIIALMIYLQIPNVETLAQGFTLIGAGIAAGIGSIGPILGGCYFTKIACKSSGRNRAAFPKLFTFTFISQAIIETPIIFATIIALLLTRQALTPYENPIVGIAYLIFGATIGIGTFGAGISSGKAAAAAANQIAYNPPAYTILSRASMMAQGLIDTAAVYAFIIALWLIMTPLVS